MRISGLVVVATAIVGLTACRCNKAPGPQTLPSSQPVKVEAAPSASTASTDEGGPTDAIDAGAAEAVKSKVVVVMPLDFAPTKGSKYKPLKLNADGAILRADKVIAKIVDDKLTDDDGSPIATFVPPGTISITGSELTFKFNEKDELEGPTGLRIALMDDGIPKVVTEANAAPEKLTGKFVDFNPKARRAALVVLAIHQLKQAAKATHSDDKKGSKGEHKKDKKKKHKKKKD